MSLLAALVAFLVTTVGDIYQGYATAQEPTRRLSAPKRARNPSCSVTSFTLESTRSRVSIATPMRDVAPSPAFPRCSDALGVIGPSRPSNPRS